MDNSIRVLTLLGKYNRILGFHKDGKREALLSYASEITDEQTRHDLVRMVTKKQRSFRKRVETLSRSKKGASGLAMLLLEIDDYHLLHHGLMELWNYEVDCVLSLPNIPEDERLAKGLAMNVTSEWRSIKTLHYDILKDMAKVGVKYGVAELTLQFKGVLLSNPLGCYLNLANPPADSPAKCLLESQDSDSHVQLKLSQLLAKFPNSL